MTDTELREKLDDIRNEHSCYGCYDSFKRERRKCPSINDELIAIIHSYAEAWAEEKIQSIQGNVGAYPEDIGNYYGELRGKWEERRRVHNIIEDQFSRNHIGGEK